MLFEEQGYNYSLNIFLSQYVKPLLNAWFPEWHDEDFNNFTLWKLSNSPNLKASKNSTECWCCGSSQTNYDKNERMIKKDISEFFHTLKKGNLTKIPKFEL